MPLHSWELPDPEPEDLAGGQAQPLGAAGNPGQDQDSREEAGRELAELLLTLHVQGQLTAKRACIISWWAHKAGAQGPVKELKHNPKANSGHFQRHLDRVAGLRGKGGAFYKLPVPGHTKHSVARLVHDVKVLPPHECLHAEHTADPDIIEKLQESEWPVSYTNHRVVQDSPGPVVPVALYLDGAQYIKRDAVLVFVTCNLLSGARHLNCILKKKDLCRCGCRGWCSIRPVMAFLNWSYTALATGNFPVCQHDGAPWPAEEERRASLGGRQLALKAAVTQIKGDWAEFAHTLCFPSWRHLDYPCIWCHSDRNSLYEWEGTDAFSTPWAEVTMADYENACARCERHITIDSVETLREIVQLLRYDKRTQGSRGRALTAAIPRLQLQAGDRLEPCPACPDVGQFQDLAPPATVVFWRPSLDTHTRHRNPLFSADTGITIRVLCVDPLHCLYLGVFQVHCSNATWAMIEADVFRTGQAGHNTAEERLQASCLMLQTNLHTWCRRRRQTHPQERFTEVQDITPNMLGLRGQQRLGLKGGETKTYMQFMQHCLAQFSGQIENGQHMLTGGQALLDHIDVMKQSGRKFTAAQQQDNGRS